MSRLFGEIAQNGYVVRDLDTAIANWVEVLEVGPWFYFEGLRFEDFRYRGEPSKARVDLALANSGDLQIELIQPADDSPSMYRDFLAAGNEGLQHVCYWTTEYQQLYDTALARGYTVGQEGAVGGAQGRFAYLETGFHPGTVVEISDVSGPKRSVFDFIRKTAAEWDGSKPIRRM
ncbi:VOC family protein [Saccharopolyspora sp. 6M]|uniref:VOC family protein n=1 Tax=Saccharopolyspora sp. 6M TaxID=2877237 RepID=UPI001CD45424|nr:VOC family protein [Saccharopolyspora sp. 6M]MCA1227466.1 VOC family protein [Saccharopolyspora sp. 6M]